MFFAATDHNKRSEPRFQPQAEKVRWRVSGRGELEAGELLDVSKMGLSFSVPASQDSALQLGEELSVGFLGSDEPPARYAVVWEHWAEGNLAVGCSRLSADERVAANSTNLPKLVLAINRRNTSLGQGYFQTEESSVTVLVKPSEFA